MPISHICPACGVDLARVRPARHPSLPISVVCCPECGAGTVRRKHPLIRDARRFLRTRRALWTLIGQCALFAGFLTVIAATAHGVARWTIDDDVSLRTVLLASVGSQTADARRVDPAAPFIFIFFSVTSIAAGLWLGAALPHWRIITRPPAFAAALAVAAATPVIAWALFVVPVNALAGQSYNYIGTPRQAWPTVAAISFAALAVATLAMPIGLGMRAMLDAHHRSRRRRMISKTRIARSGG